MGQERTGMMRTRPEVHAGRSDLRLGFTLIELLVVMTIIGIIIVFLLVAAGDARRRAEEDATLALTTKLEGGLNDRLDALLQNRPDPTQGPYGHYGLSSIYYSATGSVLSAPRAQVFALYDLMKREMPDVFVVQNFNPSATQYPLNFAANPHTIDPNLTAVGQWVLPLDAGTVQLPSTLNWTFSPGEGIYGASYAAAAGIYKNLGYLPAGYDGIDNDGDGYVDNWNEGTNGGNANQVLNNLAAHLHHTARSETLYAILVEGVGPLGSVFNRDDFTDREVKDTDGDGLPEFVDAWGQPLQFFRWPLMYHSDTQKGQVIDYWDYTQSTTTPKSVEWFNPPYRTIFEAREQDPLDPNQQLMAPAWWSANSNLNPFNFAGNASSVGGSGGVLAFEYYFHRLTEPFQNPGTPQFYWDRSSAVYPNGTLGLGYRRAFFSKPLIVSAGPDQQPGVFLYPDTPGSQSATATQLLSVENNAVQFDATTYTGTTIPPSTIQVNSTTYQLREDGRDDISNQNRQATGGSGGS